MVNTSSLILTSNSALSSSLPSSSFFSSTPSSSSSSSYSPSQIHIDQFDAKYLDSIVYFTILQFPSAMYIWIGEVNGIMSNLSIGLQLSRNSYPSSTQLFGSPENEFSTLLANRLAKRFNQTQIFVSYALEDKDEVQCHWAERQVIQKLINSTNLRVLDELPNSRIVEM